MKDYLSRTGVYNDRSNEKNNDDGRAPADNGGNGIGFKSFNAYKRLIGKAGSGKAWHHIVEQTPSNISRFGPEMIHNTNNLIALPHGKGKIHSIISGHYSSITDYTGGLTVRKWLSSKSFEEQYQYGVKILKMFGFY